jgi:hypothetical protein
VITGTSVAGSRGPWSAKQRLILSAIAYESSHARLAAATSTFALVRTPVTYLVSGSHAKTDMCYCLLLDPASGELRTYVWPDAAPDHAASSSRRTARLLVQSVFDLPQDVQATRILGKLPVAWSFAIRELPAGPDQLLSPEIDQILAGASADPRRAERLELELSGLGRHPEPAEVSPTQL